MSSWAIRPAEERSLLNPAFCSCLLWQAASGYESIANKPLPMDVAFLILPVVLHAETRELLPKTVRTSLTVWLNENPLSRSRIADSAQTLLPFTKDALIFGGMHKLIDLKGTEITPNIGWKKRLEADLVSSTDEVRACMKCAEFVGKWFARAGNPNTIMAIIGVRP
jgi:Family of unknown function (DUF6521)